MRFVYSAAVTACCVMALTATAAARPVPVDLRVEGADSRALTAARYMTDTTSIRTVRQPGCRGSRERKQLAGPTALGALVDGSRANRRLRPLLVSDQFDFGLLLCGVAGDDTDGSSSFWLYKVNHLSPEVGGDVYSVRRGDDVLWYFVDSAANRNTGDELELVAPARALRGAQFDVRVYAYDFAGVRRPVEGALVTGGSSDARSDAAGVARVSVDRNGTPSLRATLDPHVPSAPTSVCVHPRLARCPRTRGGTIFGSRRADRIKGTAGPDLVRAGRGNDRVNVRRGGVDTVRCGRGRDVVLAGRRDRVADDCEVVRRRGQQ